MLIKLNSSKEISYKKRTNFVRFFYMINQRMVVGFAAH